ncbi:MAG: glycosyltransferase family 2 protein, partial [Bacteroidales bacterium]|nr:glycosyltransferase family 2 protein [Bacteroidales bacterium]
MSHAEIVFIALQGLLLFYLGGTAVYLFVFSVLSLFSRKEPPPLDFKKRKFAILIPCYQEDEVIFEVAEQALLQEYPTDLFDVIVIADKFEKSTIQRLSELPIILFDENFAISTKTRALNHALRNLPDNKYDIAVILDGDNLMEPEFLAQLNDAFSFPYLAIQGHRMAKNLNTDFAILDAVSEEINNNIFRKAHRKIGLSSALIGSAMAFRYDFFKKLMSNIEVVGG